MLGVAQRCRKQGPSEESCKDVTWFWLRREIEDEDEGRCAGRISSFPLFLSSLLGESRALFFFGLRAFLVSVSFDIVVGIPAAVLPLHRLLLLVRVFFLSFLLLRPCFFYLDKLDEVDADMGK